MITNHQLYQNLYQQHDDQFNNVQFNISTTSSSSFDLLSDVSKNNIIPTDNNNDTFSVPSISTFDSSVHNNNASFATINYNSVNYHQYQIKSNIANNNIHDLSPISNSKFYSSFLLLKHNNVYFIIVTKKDNSSTSNKIYGTSIKTSTPNTVTTTHSSKVKTIDSSTTISQVKSSKSTSTTNSLVSTSAIANINITSTKSNTIDAQLANEIYKKSFETPAIYNPNIQVSLDTKPLWDKFASIGTEMIITKCGR
jgi:hypothetical protein